MPRIRKNKGMSDLVASIRTETDQLWDTYEQLHGSKLECSDTEIVRKVVHKLHRSVFGNGTSYHETQRQAYYVGEWFDIIYRYAVEFATEKWNATGETNKQMILRGEDWYVAKAMMERRLAKLFLTRGYYLTQPDTPKPKVRLSREEERQGKIRKLEQRQKEWQQKLDRAQRFLRSINRRLSAYRRHEI